MPDEISGELEAEELRRLLLAVTGRATLLPIAGGSGDDDAGGDDSDDDASDSDDDADGDDDLGDKGQKALKAERERAEKAEKAARTARRELKALNERLAALEAAGKPDAERQAADAKRLQDERDAAVERAREKAGRAAVIDAATKAGARNPDAIYRSLRSDLEYDDDDEPVNVDELMEQARTDEPERFRPKRGGTDAAEGNRGGDTKEREIKPGLDRLSHAYATSSKTKERR